MASDWTVFDYDELFTPQEVSSVPSHGGDSSHSQSGQSQDLATSNEDIILTRSSADLTPNTQPTHTPRQQAPARPRVHRLAELPEAHTFSSSLPSQNQSSPRSSNSAHQQEVETRHNRTTPDGTSDFLSRTAADFHSPASWNFAVADESSGDSEIAMSRARRGIQTQVNNLINLTTSPVHEHPQTSQGRKRRRNEEDEAEASKKSRTLDKVQSEEWSESSGRAETEQQPSTSKDDGQARIGKMSCIICLESYTNATVSHCGHIFCHECLTRALIASEKNNDRRTGVCPSCRKPIKRKNAGQMFPINFMKQAAFKRRKSG